MNGMHQLLLDAAASHPERAEYDRALEHGVAPDRAGRLLSTQKPLTLRAGRSSWLVQNNPTTLAAHAAAVAKCPGFNGRKTPKPRLRSGGGDYYRHPDGFRLFIPGGMMCGKESDLWIGSRKFKLDHKKLTITGVVPASWLVDLNAGPAEPEIEEELQGVADLL